MRGVVGSAWPGLAVLLAALACLEMPALGEPVVAFLRAYPFLISAVAALLALAFRSGRALQALLALSLAQFVLTRLAPAIAANSPEGIYAFDAVGVLLPANLALAALAAEKGVLSGATFVRLVVVAAQPFAAWFLWLAYLPGLARLLHDPIARPDLTQGTPMSQPALLVLAFAAVVVVFAFVRAPAPLEGGLAWSLVGAFLAVSDRAGGAPTPVFFAASALAIAVALVHSSAASSVRDPLTGLPGRRAFDEELGRLGRRFTVAMVDIDHFKQFNDTHGHDVGDQVLRMVATRLRQVGGGGRAFRYGGEEFTVVFRGRSLKETLPRLEALRAAIAGADFTLRGADRPRKRPKEPPRKRAMAPKLSLTVSVGVAESGTGVRTVEEVLHAADAALYRAKSQGRNRMCSSGG